MFFRRVYDEGLAQASYIIGCQQVQKAIVIDPNLDIDTYIRIAEQNGLTIAHVTETHIHADFASGARELAKATGATLHVSAEGGKDWAYPFLGETGTAPLHDGDRITVGNVHLDVIHTPGHTPEHLTFLVMDSARSKAYAGALTGDFIFIGDVGRPDLLEVAAGQVGTRKTSAATLYNSVQRCKKLPDHLLIWPGHGSGSACGKSLSAAEVTTLGYEKLANWAFEPMDEDEFVDRVLEGQPTAPPYFGAMKVRNKNGDLSEPSDLPRKLTVTGLETAKQHHGENIQIIDVRNQDEWDRGHIESARHIPLHELHNRLGELSKDTPIIVYCQRGPRSAKAAATLDAFGFKDVHDMIGGYSAWEQQIKKADSR